MSQLNATDSSRIFTTESAMVFDSTEELDSEEFEDLTLDPNEDDANRNDDIDFQTSTSEPTSKRSSRRKRHINFPGGNPGDNNEYTMEVMVAVDRKMQEYHGNNIQAYVLTLMSIVSNIYSDASIGNSINVAVVHIFLLKDDLHIESNHIGKNHTAGYL